MADLSHLSDDDLAQIASGKGPAPTKAPDLSHLSDEQLSQIANAPQQNRPWYSVSGEGLKQSFKNALPGTGTTIGQTAGAALGPVGEIVGGGVGNVAGEIAKSATQPNDRPWYSVSGSGLAQAVKNEGSAFVNGMSSVMGGQVIGKGIEKAGGLLRKTVSEFSGVPDKEIENYATRADKVNGIIGDNTENGTFNSQHAADTMKDNVMNDVKRTKGELNTQISQALKNSPPDKVFSTTPIKEELQSSIDQLHPIYDKDQINKIKGIMGDIDQSSTNGMMSIKDLQDTKEHLYSIASGAYQPSSRFFQSGTDVSNAAKMAGRSAKEMLDTNGPQEIVNANRQLSQLHDIESGIGKNLLESGKNASPLYAVGSGVQNQNSEALKDLGNMTGGNYMQDAKDLSTARTFANPSIFSKSTTGKSVLGPVVGTTVGSGAGAAVAGPAGAWMGGKIGGVAGTVLSSPAALKLAIDKGSLPMSAINDLINTPQGRALLTQALTQDGQSSSGPSNVIKSRTQLGL